MKRTLKYAFSTGRELHVDQLLSQVAINYRPNDFVVDQIMPIVNVQHESDIYPIFSRAEWLRIETALRARGAEANKIVRSVSSDRYQAINYALKTPIYLEDRVNADPIYVSQLINGAAEYLTAKHWLAWEKRVTDLLAASANVSTVFVPASSWNSATGDPISQISQMIEQFQARTSKLPNQLVFGWRAFRLFARNVNVRNVILGNNNGGGFVDALQAKALFGVDKVLISQLFVNSANENQAEAIGAPFHDVVAAMYVPPAASLIAPSWGYSFRWSGGGLPNMTVERHPFDTKTKTDEIEVGYYQAEKVTASEYAAIIAGVGSAQANGLA